MKVVLIILFLFIIAIPVALFVLGMKSQQGKAPGLTNNQLSQCPDKPNCVCSESEVDTMSYIEPLPLPSNDIPTVLIALKENISAMEGKIVTEEGLYLAATFSSKLFKFTDDFELRIDPQVKLIHVRSASRVGRGDLGVNKKRVDLFRKRFKQSFAD